MEDFDGLEEWLKDFAAAATQTDLHGMLNRGIFESYKAHRKQMLEFPEVELVGEAGNASGSLVPAATVARISATDFVSNHDLQDEVFGPYCLAVICKDANELTAACKALHGQLTGTFYGTDADLQEKSEAIEALKMQGGRLAFGGAPTGVEVNTAMQHGGPFPATTDARFTSVGTQAIYRFVRPLAYQNWPETALPPELQKENPLGLWRSVNGIPGKH
jgi:NADP-dependent aldehyde dehydrogenase